MKQITRIEPKLEVPRSYVLFHPLRRGRHIWPALALCLLAFVSTKPAHAQIYFEGDGTLWKVNSPTLPRSQVMVNGKPIKANASRPVLYGNYLYFVSDKSVLTKWKINSENTPIPLSDKGYDYTNAKPIGNLIVAKGHPYISVNYIYYRDTSNNLCKCDPDGIPVTDFQKGIKINSRPVVYLDYIYAANQSGKLTRWDLNGRNQNIYNTGTMLGDPTFFDNPTAGSTTLAGPQLIIASTTGHGYSLTLKDNKLYDYGNLGLKSQIAMGVSTSNKVYAYYNCTDDFDFPANLTGARKVILGLS